MAPLPRDVRQQPEMDWTSAVSCLLVVVIAGLALLTVYVGATQFLSQNRIYNPGLSWRSIGSRRATVKKWGLLGFQRRTKTSSPTLPLFVERGWEAQPMFSVEIPKEYPRKEEKNKDESTTFDAEAREEVARTDEKLGSIIHESALLKSQPDILESYSDADTAVEKGMIPSRVSWVNLMQALALYPTDDGTMYEMRDAPELFNNTVPRQWKGQDLAAICSMLGFQSYDKSPNYEEPISLPIQWSGPLGWLQFRSSPDGCVVEFQKRMDMFNGIPDQLYNDFCTNGLFDPNMALEPHFIESRLWNSIGGLRLSDGYVLFLAGSGRVKRLQENGSDDHMMDDKPWRHLMSEDFQADDIHRKLFGERDKRNSALRKDMDKARGDEDPGGWGHRYNDPHLSDFVTIALGGKIKPGGDICVREKEVLTPCQGLLRVDINSELETACGLGIIKILEYDRKYIPPDDVNHIKHPYQLGNLVMDKALLALIKDAILLLRPDGFFFSPTASVFCDVSNIYSHMHDQSNNMKNIFPDTGPTADMETLHFGMKLCNELQLIRKSARTRFSVNDMCLLARAVHALKGILNPAATEKGNDLVWAMLACPEISRHVHKWLLNPTTDMQAFLAATAKSRDGVLRFSSLIRQSDGFEGDDKRTEEYEVPLMGDGDFTGAQVVAALAIAWITYFWIDAKWITDVASCSTPMPRRILML